MTKFLKKLDKILGVNKTVSSAKNISYEIVFLIILIVAGYIFIHDILGGTLFTHEYLDSYTVQARAWLDGKTYIEDGDIYTWLELAIYEGKYYVSFPPVPTLIWLPFIPIVRESTPNNLIVAIYAVFIVIGAYKACKAVGFSEKQSIFWTLFATYATNLMDISTNGGVWYQAQTLNMAFLVWAIYFAIKNKKLISLILIALAVGCRPFSLLYMPVVLVYFYLRDKKEKPDYTPVKILKGFIVPMIPVAVIGLCYMTYNYIRFDNPLEFGHNYLPSVTNSEYGQFSIKYLANHLKNILTRPVKISLTGDLDVPMHEGFMFYVCNPIFIVWYVRLIKDILNKRVTKAMAVTAIVMAVNLLLLCMHDTFGAFQFGARYVVDLVPYVLFYFLLSGKSEAKPWEQFLMAFGILFNAYGTIIARLYNII